MQCHASVKLSLLFPGGGVSKQKLIGKSNSRKSKSPIPGQGYLGTERPSSVSSVHSEGDYHRQTPVWAWEDRPSSTGEKWVSFKLTKPDVGCVERPDVAMLDHWYIGQVSSM